MPQVQMPFVDRPLGAYGRVDPYSREDMSVINNPMIRRPYLNSRDEPCVTVNELDKRGRVKYTTEKGVRYPILRQQRIIDLMQRGHMDPVWMTANANSMRKDDWVYLDTEILKVQRSILTAWNDLASKNTIGGFNAMAKATFEYEAMSDPGFALIDMDAISEGQNDYPLFKLRSIPLPITHSDFFFSQRRLAISGNSTRLDTTMGEAAARRIAESVEDITIGLETGMSYGYNSTGRNAHDITAPDDGHGAVLGGSKIYGYLNYPHRLTKTNFTAPTAAGWTGETLYNEVLAAVQQLRLQNFSGPFQVYYSRDWFPYINRNFSVSGGNNAGETVLTMLGKVPSISGVKELERLTSTFTLIIVQMTKDTAAAIDGMDTTTVQWPTKGGMQQNFKVMAIKVPLIRSDYKGQCGILHGTTA
jgi:hypothetical protein